MESLTKYCFKNCSRCIPLLKECQLTVPVLPRSTRKNSLEFEKAMQRFLVFKSQTGGPFYHFSLIKKNGSVLQAHVLMITSNLLESIAFLYSVSMTLVLFILNFAYVQKKIS